MEDKVTVHPKIAHDFDDPDFFQNIQSKIENELRNLKKIVNDINQMRVEAAYLESDLVMTIDVSTWQNISEFIGLTSSGSNIGDIDVKEQLV